ncbi:MAG: hypothetical protein Q9167_007099 [Letrouitia subvulpina]
MTQAIVSFGPQLAMFKLISLLEQRSVGEAIASEAWLWVFSLGFSIIISSWIEAWLMWVVYATFALPVRSELSALIFSKSTRRKDVKGSQKAKIDATNAENGAAEPAFRHPWVSKSTKQDQELDEEEIQKTRQSTAAKLAASTCFLVILIGWPSLLAGIAVSLLSLPLNIWASRKYSQTQGNLMKTRDQKMVVVTEALNGIRLAIIASKPILALTRRQAN